MQAAVCPVCHRFVGYIPDGWRACITHSTEERHALTTERPQPDPNPD